MQLILEKLGGKVDLPVTYFTEYSFLKLNEEEQLEIINALLGRQFQRQTEKKPRDVEGKRIQELLNNSKFLFYFYFHI